MWHRKRNAWQHLPYSTWHLTSVASKISALQHPAYLAVSSVLPGSFTIQVQALSSELESVQDSAQSQEDQLQTELADVKQQVHSKYRLLL